MASPSARARQPAQVRRERAQHERGRHTALEQTRERDESVGAAGLEGGVGQLPDLLVGDGRDRLEHVLAAHSLPGAGEQGRLLELAREAQQLRPDGIGERLRCAGAERDAAPLRLGAREGRDCAPALRCIAGHEQRGLGEGADPARALVDARRGHDEHRLALRRELAHGGRERLGERVGPFASGLRLAQHHQSPRRQDRQRAQRVEQLRRRTAFRVEPVEVEVVGALAQHGGADRRQALVAHEGLFAGQQIGRTDTPAGQLVAERLGRHGAMRS